MSSSQFIKLSGWAFVVGSFAFAMIFLADSFVATLVSSVLLAIGALGLRARYGERAGRFGGGVLLIGVIAMALFYVALALFYVLNTYFGMIQLKATANFNPIGLWVVVFAGPAIVLFALTIFGLAAVLDRPMPRLNWLPVVAGVWYPLVYVYLAAYIFTHYGAYPAGNQPAIINAAMVIQALALLVLGGVLIADAPPAIATA